MRKFLAASMLVLAAATTAPAADAVEGCGTGCDITKEEALDILKKLDPGIVVTEVAPSPIQGLAQVSVKRDSQNGIFYIDSSKKYLVLGRIIDLETRSDLTQKIIEDRNVVDVAKIPLKDALVLGNKKGKKQVYVFSDPECPYCGKLHHELEALVKEDPELKVNIILIPLDMHPNAGWKSTSMVCTARQDMGKALEMLDASFANKEVKNVSCNYDYVTEAKKLGKELGINGTPMTVLPNGKVISGYRPKEEFKKQLEAALAQKPAEPKKEQKERKKAEKKK